MLSYRQLVVLWYALAVLAQWEKEEEYWVAPTKEDCSLKPPCNTLQGYKENGTFLRSNTVWKFLKGNHSLSGGVTSFVNASNILLTGEPQCEAAIDACSIHCEGEHVCMFLFASSNDITIEHLHFVYPERFLHPLTDNTVVVNELKRQGVQPCYRSDSTVQQPYEEYSNCIHDRPWVFLNVCDVTVRSVRFTGYHSHWAIVHPSGSYVMNTTEFSNMYLAPYLNTSLPKSPGHQITIVLNTPVSKVPTNIEFQNGQFNASSYFPVLNHSNSSMRDGNGIKSYPVIHVISQGPLKGWTVDITIVNGVFLRCAALQLSALEDPGLSVTVDSVDIDGEVTTEYSDHWNKNGILYLASAIRLFTTNNCSNRHSDTYCNNTAQPISNITIKSSRFQRLLSGKGSAILIEAYVQKKCPMMNRIILKDNNITKCRSQQVLSSARSVISARQRVDPMAIEMPCEPPDKHGPYRLFIDSNRMYNNFRGLDWSCLVLQRHEHYLLRHRKVNARADCHLTCHWQGIVYVSGFSKNARVIFRGNKLSYNRAQGLTVNSAVVEMAGHNLIFKSASHYGGGIMVIGSSLILLQNGSHLNLSSNQAYVCGGGIFILDKCTFDPLEDACRNNRCFFQLVDRNGGYLRDAHLDDLDISVTLDQNMAGAKTKGTASIIFNSNIDQCQLFTNFTNARKLEVFQHIFHLDPQKQYTDKEISSVPRKICRCSDGGTLKHCQLDNQMEVHVYPGQNFTDNLAVIGDMGIRQSALVYIELINRTNINRSVYFPLELHSIHVLGSNCTRIIAPALPEQDNLALQLTIPLLTNTPNKANNIFLVDYINVYLNSTCPLGYDITGLPKPGYDTTGLPKHPQCTCLKQLEKHNIACSLEKQTFQLPKNHWIGTKPSQDGPHLVFALHCPTIYCATAYTSMEVALVSQHEQCMHGRTGVLCGQCPENTSVKLGSLDCGHCDSNAGILIIFFYIVAGPLLIAIICLLNLTVTAGSINGIFLYVTIIGINKDVLTTSSHSDKILSIMTFDFSIETCVYIGMDEFAVTLSSYFFPLYLLFLVGVAMCLPKWRKINMHKINRLIGPRITPVLATVIFLSYTKLAVSVIKSLLAVQLFDAETGGYTYVWMFDGNLEYFHAVKHIILATLALLVFTCFLLPVTVIAIFGDLFRRFSKGPWYMNFLDTFHGAFRFRFGFWIGIRMLIGVVIMVLKVSLVEPREVYLATATIAIAVLLFQNIFWPYREIRIRDCVTEGIKEKYFPPNVCQKIIHSIDNCYLINIMFVFMYLVHNPGQVYGALSLSITAAGLEFVGILIYHILEYTPLGQCLIETRYKLRRRYRRWKEERREAQQLRNTMNQDDDTRPTGVQCVLVLRASDCRDSDSNDSIDSDSDDGCETNGDALATDKVKKEDESQMQTEGHRQRRAPPDRDTLRIPLLKQ